MMFRKFISFLLIFVFASNTFAVDFVSYKSSGPNPYKVAKEFLVPPNEVEIGPKTIYYTSTPTAMSEEDELRDVQVPIPRSMRILNTKGNCVWCSMSVLGHYAGLEKVYNITKNVKDGGDPRCQGGSSPSPVLNFLKKENIKYEMITDKSRTDFLVKYCKVERRGVAFDIPGHMLNLVHYDPDTKIIKVIDNADRSLAVQIWSWEKFHRIWGGWAYVIFNEPDTIPYKYNPWTAVPVFRNDRPVAITREYFPLPFTY